MAAALDGDAVPIKFMLRKDIRRYTPAERPSLSQLLSKVAAIYDVPAGSVTKLTYADEEGDQVTLASEADVAELYLQALPVVRITVHAPDWAAARAEEAEAAKAAKKAAKEAEKKAAWRAKLQAKAAAGDARAQAKLAKLLARQEGETVGGGSKLPSAYEQMPELVDDDCSDDATSAGKEAGAAAEAEEVAVHPGITCDGCDMTPLMGHRFKSMDRPDFDLCEGCKAKDDAYWARDNFVLIERPCLWRGARGPCGPPAGRGPGPMWRTGLGAGRMGRHGCGPRGSMPPMPMRGFQGPPSAPFCGGPPPPFHHHPPPPFFYQRPFHYGAPPAAMGRADSAEYGKGPPPGGAGQPPAGKADKPEARFVLDVSVPDGTEMAPGQRLTKTWRMRNSGSAPWAPSGRDLLLLHVGGDALAAKPVTRLACQPPAPGQEVDVSVELVAPSQPGRYVGYFRLAEEGVERHERFGQRVWASILVPPPAPASVADADADGEQLMKQRSDALATYTESAGLKALPEQYQPPEIVHQAESTMDALYPVPMSMPGPSSSGPPSAGVGEEWVDIPGAQEA